MHELHVRDARPDDRGAIEAVTLAAFQQYAALIPAYWEGYRENILATLANVREVQQIVAEQDDAIVGTVLFYPAGSVIATPGGTAVPQAAPELRLLAVEPTARGRGIGAALVLECSRRARRSGARALTLHTADFMETAMRLYRRLGFQRAAELDFEVAPGATIKGYRLSLEAIGSARSEVGPLVEAHTSIAAAALARAFHDDPLTQYMIPESDRRAHALPTFYTASVRLAARFGEVFTTLPDPHGAALWFPPGLTDLGREHFEAVGTADLADRLPAGAFERFISVIRFLDPMRRRDVPEPHWYLAVLGVEPDRQGMGLGRALIAPILARADADRLPCYLETQKPKNVPFYESCGFEVVVREVEPHSGIPFATMKRAPKRQ